MSIVIGDWHDFVYFFLLNAVGVQWLPFSIV